MISWSQLPVRRTMKKLSTTRSSRKNMILWRTTDFRPMRQSRLRRAKEVLSERKEAGGYERYERAFARVQNGLRTVSTNQHGSHPVEESLLSPARGGSGHARTA